MEPLSFEQIHGMTPNKLRKYPHLSNLTDEEADKIIFSLFQLTALFFEFQPAENMHVIDNQLVVSLSEQKHAA